MGCTHARTCGGVDVQSKLQQFAYDASGARYYVHCDGGVVREGLPEVLVSTFSTAEDTSHLLLAFCVGAVGLHPHGVEPFASHGHLEEDACGRPHVKLAMVRNLPKEHFGSHEAKGALRRAAERRRRGGELTGHVEIDELHIDDFHYASHRPARVDQDVLALDVAVSVAETMQMMQSTQHRSDHIESNRLVEPALNSAFMTNEFIQIAGHPSHDHIKVSRRLHDALEVQNVRMTPPTLGFMQNT
mmetsp:Transcript_15446/g.27325  ORF Transcript_15446/g.27325 Transcript_15446/m.27325 type:complete len:244 (-) Transcript_15446:761-1492(-)